VKTNKVSVLVSGAAIMLMLGILYVWGVFNAPIMKLFEWDKSQSSMVFSVMIVSFVAGIVFGGKVQNTLGPKKVVLGGGLMFALGFLLSSFVPMENSWLLYLSYGLISGLGVGATYTAIISTAQRWYPNKKGLATGISVGAFGFSNVIFAPVIRKMLETMSVQVVFRIFSAVFFIVILLAFSFINNPESSGDKSITLYGDSPSKMLKSKNFYILALTLGFATMLFFFINPLLMILATERGIDEKTAVIGVMITGIANASGRLLVPIYSDFVGYRKTIVSLLVITALGAISMIFVQGILFFGVAFLVALAFGGYSAIYPVATVSNFGPKYLSTNYGFVMIGFGLSALSTPYIGRAFQKVKETGGLDLTNYFIFITAICILAIFMILILKENKKEVKK